MKEILSRLTDLAKKTRLLAVVGLSCLFLSIFFTYVKYTVLGLAVKIKLIEYFEGKIMILLILCNLLFIFKDYVKKYVPKLFQNEIGKKIDNINDQRITLIPTVLTVIFAFAVKGETKVEYLNISYSLGFFLMWIGIISLVAYPFIYKKEKVTPTVEIQNSNSKTDSSLSSQKIKEEKTNTNNNKIENGVQNASVNSSSTAAKKCPNCGTMCESNNTKCPTCGKSF